MIGYNIFNFKLNRWTKDPSASLYGIPVRLTLERAKHICACIVQRCGGDWEVREVDFTQSPPMPAGYIPLQVSRIALGPSDNTPVINNHTCPTCRNDRCNKNERSCWKCGNEL